MQRSFFITECLSIRPTLALEPPPPTKTFHVVPGTHLRPSQPVKEPSQACLEQCPCPRALVVIRILRGLQVQNIILVQVRFWLVPLCGLRVGMRMSNDWAIALDKLVVGKETENTGYIVHSRFKHLADTFPTRFARILQRATALPYCTRPTRTSHGTVNCSLIHGNNAILSFMAFGTIRQPGRQCHSCHAVIVAHAWRSNVANVQAQDKKNIIPWEFINVNA